MAPAIKIDSKFTYFGANLLKQPLVHDQNM